MPALAGPCLYYPLVEYSAHWVLPAEEESELAVPPRAVDPLISRAASPWGGCYLRRSYFCRTDPLRQHGLMGSDMSLFRLGGENAVVSTRLHPLCYPHLQCSCDGNNSDACLSGENYYLWLSKPETYRMGGSCRRTRVSQSHQKSKWKGWRNGCSGGISLGEGPKGKRAGGRRLHVIFPFIPVSRAKVEKSTLSPFPPLSQIFHLGNLVILSSVGLICCLTWTYPSFMLILA